MATDPVSLLSGMDPREIYAAALAEKQKRDLWSFVEGAWPIHHKYVPLVESQPMRIICERLEAVTAGQIQNLLMNVQPGLGKSLLVSVYWPAWELATWEAYNYMCIGGLKEVVLRDAVRMHQVIDSPWYQGSFLPQWTWSKEQDAKSWYTTTAGGGRMSRSIDQGITGLRGNRRIIDDPVDAMAALYEAAKMQQANDFLGGAFSTRKSSKSDPFVGIMQRLGEMDPSWWILENMSNVEHVMIPNEHDGVKRFDCLGVYEWRTKIGELACEALCDADETAAQKKQLKDEYPGQFNQSPMAKYGKIFQHDYFQRWDPDNLPAFDAVVDSWDLNNLKERKATKDTDPVGCNRWARAGDDYYLLWRYNRLIGLADSISAILKAIEGWPKFRDDLGLTETLRLRKALIEGKANGKSAVAVLEAMPVIGKLIESIPVQGETKGQRAKAHEYTIKGEHLYLPPKQSPYEWVDAEWLPLVCGFPRKRHDEDVDCTTQALLWFAMNKASGFHCG